MQLPKSFENRMKAMLGEDYALFAAAMEAPSVHAMRQNPIKPVTLSPAEDMKARIVSPVPFDACGYVLAGNEGEETKWGNTPWHHAGVIYLQDAAAMATVCAAPPLEGARVLDMCAAPGGKTTQLSARVGREGIVVANEYAADRLRALRGNVERLGCANVVLTHLDTRVLAETYPGFFDLVLCDAPCSGEGMFRKYPQAVTEWSPENVAMCAERQKEILCNAVACLRPGGYLLYSTCTFSAEENEENCAYLLEKYPALSLCPLPEDLQAISRPGMAVGRHDLSRARRFYPHTAPGEGQFVALFRLSPEASFCEPKAKNRDKQKGKTNEISAGVTLLPEKDARAVRDFLAANLTKSPKGRLVSVGDTVCLSPEIVLPPFGVVLPGAALGTLQKGRLEPHHHLFSAFGTFFRNRLDLTPADPATDAYLHGAELDCAPTLSGWGCVTLCGAPLGGFKASCGKAKNHYPKGLRLLS